MKVRGSDGTRWLAELESDDAVVYRVGRDGDEFVAEWPDALVVKMTPDEEAPRIEVAADADAGTVEKVKNGFLRGLVHHLQGGFALHASAAAGRRGAVLFAGESTAGKSSVAFALSRTLAVPLLADDASLVAFDGGEASVLASESSSWLRDEAARAFGLSPSGEKTRVVAFEGSTAARSPLAAVVVLSFEDGVDVAGRLTKLHGLAAMSALLPCVIRWDLSDARGELEFSHLASLLGRVPVYAFTRPHGIEHLPSQIATLRDSLLSPE